MDLIKNAEVYQTFPVALGSGEKGPKSQRGDRKTPQGHYQVSDKRTQSQFHLFIEISYPNKEDQRRAELLGVDPGDNIGIHGMPNDMGAYFEEKNWPKFIVNWIRSIQDSEKLAALINRFNWTAGCIAVSNDQIEKIDKEVSIGTPVIIVP